MRRIEVIILAVAIVCGCGRKQGLSSYVNPFIGASTSIDAAGVYHGLGKTFPGAATPFGMTQVSPNTITGGDNGPGYSYEHGTIEGFAFTQMSGVGYYGDFGNFLVMPTTGEFYTTAGKEDGSFKGWRSRYDKETEKASAGYYSAFLTDYGILAETTASPHGGALRFTYPANGASRIQIDLARRVGGTAMEEFVKVIDDRTIEGWMYCPPEGGGWGHGDGKADYTVYFHAELDHPFANYGFWSADIPEDMSPRRDGMVSLPYLARVDEADIIRGKDSLQGRHIGFFAEFPTADKEQVTFKAAISFTGLEGARKNFEAEIAGKGFDDLHREAVAMWDRELSKIMVKGGSKDQKTVFYTALYHTMIDPRTFCDVDGKYTGGDGKIHEPGDYFTKRTIFSGWDVFRSQMPLQTLINPKITTDIINSAITLAEESGNGFYPRWEIANAYSGCMLGNPMLSVIADAVAQGIEGFDLEKAYLYGKNTSAHSGNGDIGFAPGGQVVSETLEYAYGDWCLGVIADAAGDSEGAEYYRKRGQAYRNVFDPDFGWFRPRNADGTWTELPPEGRMKEGFGATECNLYQQGWFVPHDPDGLAYLLGGREKALEELRNFFANTPLDFHWNGYYNHANEPVHFVPFLFNAFGSPAETQKWTRTICANAYRNAVEGICGNEDCGQMSAWYILAACGLHPSCPGNNVYELTSPVFDRIDIQTSRGPVRITAHGNGPENIYIQKVTLGGKPVTDYHIEITDLKAGSRLEFWLGPVPPPQAPLNVIFETDLGNDVDDAMALDLLYKYVESGKVNLLAIMINKDGTAPAEYADILNTWYGHGIPIGRIRNGADCENDGVNYAKAVVMMKDSTGNPLFERSGIDYEALPDAHVLYRKILAGLPDKSVKIVSVGFSTNLSRLLDSGPDEYSPLNGKDLVARKVISLNTMAGDFRENPSKEYNVLKDIPACQNVFANWPGEIVTSPFEVGIAILYPGDSIQNDLDWGFPHPMAEGYKSYMKMPYDRPTWDLTAVLYAVEGGDWFTMSGPGMITVNDDGTTSFTPSVYGKHRYFTVTEEQAEAVKARFIDLITTRPARY